MTHSRQVPAPLLAACTATVTARMHPQIAYLANAAKGINHVWYTPSIWTATGSRTYHLMTGLAPQPVSCIGVLVFVHHIHVLLLVVLYSAC